MNYCFSKTFNFLNSNSLYLEYGTEDAMGIIIIFEYYIISFSKSIKDKSLFLQWKCNVFLKLYKYK